ncbi:MAG: hypothetical protein FH753_15615 [Firmicutes bacterium]|nr:hypothetical protein [Bacillota bacterium]
MKLSKDKLVICIVTICLVITLYSIFISPTIYRYDKIKTDNSEVLIKTNKITGKSEVLDNESLVWLKAEDIKEKKVSQLINRLNKLKEKLEKFSIYQKNPEHFEPKFILSDWEFSKYQSENVPKVIYINNTVKELEKEINKINKKIKDLEK